MNHEENDGYDHVVEIGFPPPGSGRNGLGTNDRGTIRGTVTDPSGAAIPGAQVSATNTEANVTSRTVATEAGVYSITALPAGTYRVEASHPGFKNLLRSNVIVNVGTIIAHAGGQRRTPAAV